MDLSTRKIWLNGVVLETKMTVSRHKTLFTATASQLVAARRLKGVDQHHAQHERRQHQQPPEQKKQRQPAQPRRQNQQHRHADEPGPPLNRRQHGGHNDDERNAELQRRRQPIHQAVGLAVMMIDQMNAHRSFGLKLERRPPARQVLTQ